jgi:hypothetical protein
MERIRRSLDSAAIQLFEEAFRSIRRAMSLPTLLVTRAFTILSALLVALGAVVGCSGTEPPPGTDESATTAALRCGGEDDRCSVDADCCGSGPGWELVCRRRRCKVYIYDYCELDPSLCSPCTLHPEDPSCVGP